MERAPFNPDFQQYQAQLRAKAFIPRTANGHGLGYIPAPFKPPRNAEFLAAQPAKLQALPSSYDLRNYSKVSPVQNQGGYGNCWAFATFGSMESCLLTGESWDFSENNMANKHGFNYAYGAGGNHYMALAYLGRWDGPVLESDDPYSNGAHSPAGLTIQKHIQSAQFITARAFFTDNDAIKQAIMDQGGLYSAFYWDDAYHNYANRAYYYSGSSEANHAITLVGWNDAFSRTAFKSTPPGDGAFLVKNSWGTAWGDAGYFWISYYDARIGSENCLFLNAESTTNYASIHQYDSLGFCTAFGYGSTTAWGANIFTNMSGSIAAVGFYAPADGASYEVRVYTGVTAGSPTSGTLGATKAGTLAYSGYYTVALDTPAQYATRFSVVVKLTTPAYNYPIASEYPLAGYSSAATASAGESYLSEDGNSWEEAKYDNVYFNVCIKAFDAPAPTPGTNSVINDYDGDNKTDYSVYGGMDGKWYIWSSSYSQPLFYGAKWGDYRFLPVSGDFDGDDQADIAVYSEDTGDWYIYFTRTGLYTSFRFGGPGLKPVCGDYDGDGRTDYALYERPTGHWYIRSAFDNHYLFNGFKWGDNGCLPVAGDFNGGGKADIAVYSENAGDWYIYFSEDGTLSAFPFGGPGFKPACGDYDGDNRTDYALYERPTGRWYIRSAFDSHYLFNGFKWGNNGCIPVAGDFNGGGKADIAVYSEDAGEWYVHFTETGLYSACLWGSQGYRPPCDWAWY